MKKALPFILAIIIIWGAFSTAFADNAPLPYTEYGSDGYYCNLPDAGSAENGNILLLSWFCTVHLLRTRYLLDFPEYAIDLVIENTTDEDFYLDGCGTAVVDGYSFDAYCRDTVPAGGCKIVTYYILAEDFRYPAISTPQEVKFTLAFYRNEDFVFENLIDAAFFALYPSGLQECEIEYKSIWDIGYSDEWYSNPDYGFGFRIIDAKMQPDSDFYQIDILLENSTNDTLEFSLNGLKLEGQDAEAYWSCRAAAYSNAVSHIYIDTLPLNLQGKGGPDDIEFYFTAENGVDKFFSEFFAISPAKG